MICISLSKQCGYEVPTTKNIREDLYKNPGQIPQI